MAGGGGLWKRFGWNKEKEKEQHKAKAWLAREKSVRASAAPARCYYQPWIAREVQ